MYIKVPVVLAENSMRCKDYVIDEAYGPSYGRSTFHVEPCDIMASMERARRYDAMIHKDRTKVHGELGDTYKSIRQRFDGYLVPMREMWAYNNYEGQVAKELASITQNARKRNRMASSCWEALTDAEKTQIGTIVRYRKLKCDTCV